VQKDIDDHKTNLDFLDQTSRQLLNQGPLNEDSEKLRSDVQKVQWRWASLIDAATEKVSQCQSAIDQVKQFQVKTCTLRFFNMYYCKHFSFIFQFLFWIY